MTAQNTSKQQMKVLDEIIDNAVGLPIESQDLLLMMARAMRHTRDCIMKQNEFYQKDDLGESAHGQTGFQEDGKMKIMVKKHSSMVMRQGREFH